MALTELCFFFKQKTAYEMRISDWSSDVCSSDLLTVQRHAHGIDDPAHQAVAHLHHVGSTVRLNPRAIFMRSIKIKRNQERTATTETNDPRPPDRTGSGMDPTPQPHWPFRCGNAAGWGRG